MRVSRLTYPLIAIAIIPVALVSLKKINKISFFDHFFKVIEEVELRNSHELASYPDLVWYKPSLAEEATSAEVTLDFPTASLAAFPGPYIALIQSSASGFLPILRGMSLKHLLPLCRAP